MPVIGWLQHHCHQKYDTGAARKRTARRLLDHPVAAEALVEGAITVRHLEKLDHCLRSVGEDVYRALTIEASLERRCALGGTSPRRVGEAVAEARKRLAGK